jgi:hypothetical protein
MTYETTPKQDQAIREWLQASIVPLIEQVLVKKLGQAMSFAAQELGKPEREWRGLTDEEIHDMSGYEEDRKMYRFARDVEAKLKERNHG